MIRILLILILISGCSLQKVKDEIPFIPELTIAIPESEVEGFPGIDNISSTLLAELIEKYGANEQAKNYEFAPDVSFSGDWCGTMYYDDGFVPSDYLNDKPHIKFKTLGVREEWVPINGEPKRYIVFSVVK